jgi:hypothetical protein
VVSASLSASSALRLASFSSSAAVAIASAAAALSSASVMIRRVASSPAWNIKTFQIWVCRSATFGMIISFFMASRVVAFRISSLGSRV